MDIQNKGDFIVACKIILVAVYLLMVSSLSSANVKEATETLLATYKSTPLSPVETQSMITRLQEVVDDCEDPYLSFRIKYRVGAILFKIRKYNDSIVHFSRIVNVPECPELIRLFSLNMMGQASRLIGRESEALEAFDELAKMIVSRFSQSNADATLLNLCGSALFSRAEIYKAQKNYNASIAELSRLLSVLTLYEIDVPLLIHVPLIVDRISQLHLRQKNINKYLKSAKNLVKNYPAYYRTPIVKFEMECIEFSRSIDENYDLLHDSYAAPVHIIRYLKKSAHDDRARRLTERLRMLCTEHKNSYGGIILHYHYAWLLDALGQRDRAQDVLARISSTDIVNVDKDSAKHKILQTVQQYAGIQSAIILGEKGDYALGLHTLEKLKCSGENSHVSKLVNAVKESLQVLKREGYTHGRK